MEWNWLTTNEMGLAQTIYMGCSRSCNYPLIVTISTDCFGRTVVKERLEGGYKGQGALTSASLISCVRHRPACTMHSFSFPSDAILSSVSRISFICSF